VTSAARLRRKAWRFVHGHVAEHHGFAPAHRGRADQEQAHCQKAKRPKAQRAGNEEHRAIGRRQHVHERCLHDGRRRFRAEFCPTRSLEQDAGQDGEEKADEHRDKQHRHVHSQIDVHQLQVLARPCAQHGSVDVQGIRHASEENGRHKIECDDRSAVDFHAKDKPVEARQHHQQAKPWQAGKARPRGEAPRLGGNLQNGQLLVHSRAPHC
tara:strand:- start:420 stop:1052 length:633 start_codon:yes stop_codon:yes gene_type:complete